MLSEKEFEILISSVVLGFVFAYKFNYSPNKKHGKDINYRQELDLFIGKTCYHIHHWIYFSILLIVFCLGKYDETYYLSNIIMGALIGFIFEDFLFADVFWIKNNCNLVRG